MTISTQNRTAGPFIGNGSTTVFPFSFKVFADKDMLVVRTEAATSIASKLGLTADYTVTLNANQNANPGGSVTLATPLAAGYVLVLTSELEYLQPLDLTNQGGFYPAVITAAFDRVTILLQQLFTIASRSLRFPVSDTGTNTELPQRSQRANNLLGFDANGNPVAVAPVAQSATALQVLLAADQGVTLVGNAVDKRALAGALGGAALVTVLQGGTGAVPRPAQDKLREMAVSLEDFKLVVEADWANAANRACAYCYQTGATLRLKGQAYPGARIEVHGTFDVEGNGATVDFLGVGYTIIAGTGAGIAAVPSAWGVDGAIYNAAVYAPTMYALTAPVAEGADTIPLASVVGLSPGDIIFLAGNPTSASSAGNYIPANFEFAQVLSIAGNVVTLNGKVRNAYTASGAAFKSPGLARGCRISGLRLKSTVGEAYQLTIRSALNVVIDNIEFAGRDTLGSATFVEGLALRNFRSSGAGGNWSFARGTVAAIVDGLVFQYRSGMAAETNAIFVEESCYDISLRSVRGYGASFSVRQMDMAGAVVRRAITVLDSAFDTRNSPGGASSPMQCGTAAGVDIEFVNCTFAGAVVVPGAGTYPGVAGTAMCWITANQASDRVKFSACHFKSTTAGAGFKAGGGALGKILFDDLCTYEGCDAPSTQYTARGAWTAFALSGSFTAIAGYSAPAYRIQNNQVFFTGAVQVNSAASGDTVVTLPAALRPLANKLLPAGSAQTGAGNAGSVAFGLDTGGALVARWSAGVAYFGLEGLSYAIDA